MKIIILAAGKGERLGNNIPKILTSLPGNETIMDRLLNTITPHINKTDISLVVGYKKNLIIEKYPSLNYIINDNYKTTNTSKSLSLALDGIENENIIWINGDLIMDKDIFKYVYTYNGSRMAVSNKSILDDEEIKYVTNSKGNILMVSKTINNGLGEAFGLNKITKKDLNLFKISLKKCADTDYFEKGIEIAISNGLIINPLDINDMFYTEVDFKKDLDYAINFLNEERKIYE